MGRGGMRGGRPLTSNRASSRSRQPASGLAGPSWAGPSAEVVRAVSSAHGPWPTVSASAGEGANDQSRSI